MAKFQSDCGSSIDVFKPVCLIDNDKETGNFRCHTKVLEQIEKIDKPLNVIAITGFSRTGKSYLMSRLAGKNKGFPLGSTIQAQTKGIWVWCCPHPKDSEQVLLLMDSEGLGDIEKADQDHDNKLFALITMLSATLIYNIIGVLNQDVLDKLNFITEISRYIKIKETILTDDDDSELDLCFPELIVTMRDKTLEMKIDGKDLTPDEYLEHCLNVVPGDDEASRKKNLPRLCIRKYFKHRHCFTFDRPSDCHVLKQLEELTDNDLAQTFVEDAKQFSDFIFNNCKPMTITGDKFITGRTFGYLLKSYVEAINAGRMPNVENAVRTLSLTENQKAFEKAVETYTTKMREKIRLTVADDRSLSTLHEQCLDIALNVFHKHAFMDENNEYIKKTNASIWKEYTTIKHENEQASESKCSKLLRELHKPIKEKFERGIYIVPGGYNLYQTDILEMKEKYDKEGSHLGVMKDKTLRNFEEDIRNEEHAVIEADTRLDEAQKAIEYEKQEKASLLKEEQYLKEEFEKLRREFFEQEKQNLTLMDEQKKNYEAMMQEQQKKNEILNACMREEQRLVKEQMEKEAMKTREEFEHLKKENEETNQKLQEASEALEKEKAKLECKLNDLETLRIFKSVTRSLRHATGALTNTGALDGKHAAIGYCVLEIADKIMERIYQKKLKEEKK